MTVAASGRGTPLSEYLRGAAVVNGAIQGLLAAVLAGLAASRAEANVLSPTALAVVVTLATVGTVAFSWPAGAYGGAYDAITGDVAVDRGTEVVEPLAGLRAWASGARWALLAGAWAAAGGGLVVVALNEQRARWVVIAATWAVLAGGAAVAADVVARRVGAQSATRRATGPAAPMRRRAWRDVALPLALTQGAVNALIAWLLFHDYGRGAGPRLTDDVALADSTVVIVLLVAVFGSVARRWGVVDAVLGRVRPDDPDAQSIPAKAPLGPQGLVYAGLAAYALARFLVVILPPSPSLAAVVIARGLFAGVLVYAIAGIAYVRGALNEPVRS